MPICKKCGERFPNRLKINGRTRVLNRRKFCLACSPFGQHNTRSLEQLPTDCEIQGDNTSKARNRAKVIKRRKKLALMVIDYKGGKCQICGYNRCTRALEFHHLNPDIKLFALGAGNTNGWEKTKEEANKCVLLCSNCHREVHTGLIRFLGDMNLVNRTYKTKVQCKGCHDIIQIANSQDFVHCSCGLITIVKEVDHYRITLPNNVRVEDCIKPVD
jgi:5-methylcytosine-specific restriction endonuclease McrA